MTTIYIGYNERLVNKGISSLINTNGGYHIIGSSQNGDQLLSEIKKLTTDILIIELGFPNKFSYKYITKILTAFPEIKILLISSLIQEGITRNLIKLGVNAYISKKSTEKDLFNALERLENNESYFCPMVTRLLINEHHKDSGNESVNLSKREIEILNFLINGLSNEKIAKELNISPNTIKTHRKNIMNKFGAKNLLSLIRYSCRENLIIEDNDFFCESCLYRNMNKC